MLRNKKSRNLRLAAIGSELKVAHREKGHWNHKSNFFSGLNPFARYSPCETYPSWLDNIFVLPIWASMLRCECPYIQKSMPDSAMYSPSSTENAPFIALPRNSSAVHNCVGTWWVRTIFVFALLSATAFFTNCRHRSCS